MARTHNLGLPRIGAHRELKFAQEKLWRGSITHAELEALGAALRCQGWQRQAKLDLVPVADFSFYDQVLDASFLLGNVPARARAGQGNRSMHTFVSHVDVPQAIPMAASRPAR